MTQCRCFWTVVLENILDSPLDYKEIKPINPKGNQLWIFIAKTDAEAEAQILWPPDVKSWFIRKDLDAGKDWGQEDKRAAEDEMVGWHHQFSLKHMEQNLIMALLCIWVLIIYQTKDTIQELKTMEQDVYWKQDQGLRGLH